MSIGLVIAAVIVYRIIFVSFVGIESDIFKGGNKVGSNQMDFLRAIQQNENALFYSDMYWSYLSRQAMYNLFSEPPGCGVFEGFTLWDDGNKQCVPGLKELNNQISRFLRPHTRIWRESPLLAPSRTDPQYAFFLGKQGKGSVIKGTAFQPIATDIGCVTGTGLQQQYPTLFPAVAFATSPLPISCGRYYTKPAFSQSFGINLGVFEEVQDKLLGIKQDIVDCMKGGTSAVACRNTALNKIQSTYDWRAECRAGIGVAAAFEAIAGQYQACLDTPGTNCVCILDPPSPIHVKKGGYFTMQFKQNRATMEGHTDLSRTFTTDNTYLAESKDPDDRTAKALDYLMEYKDDGTFDEVFLRDFFVDYRPDSPGKQQWLYKFAPQKVAFVDSNNYDEFLDVGLCRPAAPAAVKICIDTGEKLLVHEPASNVFSVVPATLNFAIALPKP